MSVLRRLLGCFALAALAAAVPLRVSADCGTFGCAPPQLGAVTPQQLTLDGRPLHLTVVGANLTGVTSVLISPMGTPQGWTVYNDQTLLLTLPPTIAPGIYSVRVLSPQGGSDPSMAPRFEVFPAPPPPTPVVRATPTPRPTPSPTPPRPATGTLGLAPNPTPAPSAAPPLLVAGGTAPAANPSAVIAIMAGLALGALAYILWGNPRRLDGTWRSEPLRHLVGRPAQAMHVGSVCLYCGRLHFIFTTRRDLWRAHKYCRPRCFISAEATPSPPSALHTDGC